MVWILRLQPLLRSRLGGPFLLWLGLGAGFCRGGVCLFLWGEGRVSLEVGVEEGMRRGGGMGEQRRIGQRGGEVERGVNYLLPFFGVWSIRSEERICSMLQWISTRSFTTQAFFEL